MIQHAKLIIQFYKPFALASFGASFLLVLFQVDFFPACAAKSLFLGIIMLNIFTTDRKHQLNFYRNLRLGPHRIFFGILAMDLFLLASIYTIAWFLK